MRCWLSSSSWQTAPRRWLVGVVGNGGDAGGGRKRTGKGQGKAQDDGNALLAVDHSHLEKSASRPATRAPAGVWTANTATTRSA